MPVVRLINKNPYCTSVAENISVWEGFNVSVYELYMYSAKEHASLAFGIHPFEPGASPPVESLEPPQQIPSWLGSAGLGRSGP